jgi:hypothetical protein
MDAGSSFEKEPLVLANGEKLFWVGGKYRKRDAVRRFKASAAKVNPNPNPNTCPLLQLQLQPLTSNPNPDPTLTLTLP